MWCGLLIKLINASACVNDNVVAGDGPTANGTEDVDSDEDEDEESSSDEDEALNTALDVSGQRLLHALPSQINVLLCLRRLPLRRSLA